MYKPPIEITTFESPVQHIINRMAEQKEEHIYRCLLNTGVDVDKEELIKALKYDRQQYEKGYVDGVRAFANKMEEASSECLCVYEAEVCSDLVDKITKELTESKNDFEG